MNRVPAMLYASIVASMWELIGSAVRAPLWAVLRRIRRRRAFARRGVRAAVNRGQRINAVGTADRPIVFTSRDNVLGLATDDSQGQWGGVVLLGRAPITDCLAAGAAPGTIACERQTEGAVDPAMFGGATANDNSGSLRYVQIEFGRFALVNSDAVP